MLGSWPKHTLWRMGGIPVRIDATFIFVPLFFYSWAAARQGDIHWLIIATGTVGVFLSVLFHEIGHALAARRLQVGVIEIVVGGFFGYAALRRQAIPRKVLIRILAAGPFANLAVFLILWIGLSQFGPNGFAADAFPGDSGARWTWLMETLRVLAYINLAMFVFNMLPAFPLDGGKILGLYLDRSLSAQNSRLIVSLLGLTVGVAMVLFGLGISLVLSAIGLLIMVTNLRRLRRRRTAVPD